LQNKIFFKGPSQETETKNQNKKRGFRLFFLGKKDSEVEVFEVEKIDFENVKKRLKYGESVFLTTIQPPSMKPNGSLKLRNHDIFLEQKKEVNYFL
jgi:hypothetical protein